MVVDRVRNIDVGRVELGDVIAFTLKTEELVKAMAVQETSNGVLYITVDCVAAKKFNMSITKNTVIDYEHSDLRRFLNNEILGRFPDEIRERMAGMQAKDGGVDLLRIPTEKEIFGENKMGKDEGNVKQFFGMGDVHNRISVRDESTCYYWLQNRKRGDADTDVACVRTDGTAWFSDTRGYLGIRLVFCLKEEA